MSMELSGQQARYRNAVSLRRGDDLTQWLDAQIEVTA